jgi:tetratricopeptide (TPR) repeat protein
LLGLVGCHQFPSHLGNRADRDRNQEPSGGSITPAQEADVQISLGRVAEKQGDLEQATAAYRAALTRDGRRADAYLRLAVLHDKEGKFRESAELYRKALSLRPGDPEIFCDMGYSYYLQRRWAESEQNLRQAIAIDPDHRRAHNNLALLLARNNRLEDALAEFRKSGSEPAQAHLNLAFALTMEQRWESAREHYQRALVLDPASQLAKDRLGQLNALVAKMESRRDVTRQDPHVLATSADVPPSGRDVLRANAPAMATTGPLEATRPPAPRDPGLVATAANGNRPWRDTRARATASPLRAAADAMRKLWATGDSPAGTTPLGPSGPSVEAAAAPPER